MRRLGGTLHAGREGWPAVALAQAAMLHVAARAWQRRDDLPEAVTEDLRAHLGWSRTTDEVRAFIDKHANQISGSARAM